MIEITNDVITLIGNIISPPYCPQDSKKAKYYGTYRYMSMVLHKIVPRLKTVKNL